MIFVIKVRNKDDYSLLNVDGKTIIDVELSKNERSYVSRCCNTIIVDKTNNKVLKHFQNKGFAQALNSNGKRCAKLIVEETKAMCASITMPKSGSKNKFEYLLESQLLGA